MDDRLDLLLRALADRTRRALLDRLRDAPGLTLTELLFGFEQSRQALSKHLSLLEDAELVVPVWRGREKHHYLNPAPLQALPTRWVTSTAREHDAALGAMRTALTTAQLATPDGRAVRGTLLAVPASPRQRAVPAASRGDPIAMLLAAPPSSLLQGQPVMQPDALAAACRYLAETAAAVQRLLEAMDAAEGRLQPADGSFSLVEHLWHLADIETLGWTARFQRILDETRPHLPGVDGDRLALEKHYQARPWRAAARRFIAQRRRSLKTLQQFDAEVLRRPVIFAGARTRAGGVLAACVAHDLDHRPAMAQRWSELATSR